MRRSAYTLTGMSLFVALFRAELDLLRSWHSRRAYESARGILMGKLYPYWATFVLPLIFSGTWTAMIYDKAIQRRDTTGYVPPANTNKNQAQRGTADTGASADIGKIVSLMSGDGPSRQLRCEHTRTLFF
jgi:hypothetical protein